MEIKTKTLKQERLRTEAAIQYAKDVFTRQLSDQLNLTKVSSPIMVMDGTGINDDLNGVERCVRFAIKQMDDQKAVVVNSLAKWKRIRLKDYEIDEEQGIITDMRAIRPDEDYSPIHSVYVDQWDWEKRISPDDRTVARLKTEVKKIYKALKITEQELRRKYTDVEEQLPDDITFIHAEELRRIYPELTGKEREDKIAREYGAVFIIGIGGELGDDQPHDGRAPDYDDWSTENEDGFYGLNGDLLVWNPVLESAFELSSMGIRVDQDALERQLELRNETHRKNLHFHQLLLQDQLPQSIGGGIGQSRVCMFLLGKQHIGEVQVSVWPEEAYQEASMKGISLL
ncbi:aspartate--ammonia ligase [Membranicola marinus]|uniref:Aspartate--ammonia ligase n=1 Tax=Membranihabitans marinus TaxID=1227546 RepID=A0A953HWU8_9BACT|nr:aspartate--ammonia ligase [Membranihabitans marinus]MBY5959960.1 aspartate--ammonia ligase [Membranihabitans marinus]